MPRRCHLRVCVCVHRVREGLEQVKAMLCELCDSVVLPVCMHTASSCVCVIEGLGRVQVMQCRLRVCACNMCMCAWRRLAAMEAWDGYR